MFCFSFRDTVVPLGHLCSLLSSAVRRRGPSGAGPMPWRPRWSLLLSYLNLTILVSCLQPLHSPQGDILMCIWSSLVITISRISSVQSMIMITVLFSTFIQVFWWLVENVNRIWDSVFTFIGTKALVAKRPVLCLNDHRLYITVLIVYCINQMIQVVPSIRSAQ